MHYKQHYLSKMLEMSTFNHFLWNPWDICTVYNGGGPIFSFKCWELHTCSCHRLMSHISYDNPNPWDKASGYFTCISRDYPLFSAQLCRLSSMRFVYLSDCHPVAPFLSPHRTYQLLTMGFCLVVHGAGGPGVWNPVESRGMGLSRENFSPFHRCFPP